MGRRTSEQTKSGIGLGTINFAIGADDGGEVGMTEYIMRYENEVLQLLPDKIQPLIRCKDCKHCFTGGENVLYNVCELNHNKVQSDDWFCADGERNEGR